MKTYAYYATGRQINKIQALLLVTNTDENIILEFYNVPELKKLNQKMAIQIIKRLIKKVEET